MRATIPGLPSPSELITRLPGILQDDEFLQRFLPAFDDSIAPVYSVLDNLQAYVDPRLAPADFLDWISMWVDVEIDENWPIDQRRGFIAEAATLHRKRGTLRGISEAVRLVGGPGVSVEVTDSGGVSTSTTSGAPFPGSAATTVRVTIGTAATMADDSRERLRRAVASSVPAHVPFTLLFLVEEGGVR